MMMRGRKGELAIEFLLEHVWITCPNDTEYKKIICVAACKISCTERT